jgi:hypothetical protein|tara:strand:+ start:509 stop:895 length:387 start_codon:yes stop_codon:yes gene_type:complete
VRIAEVDAGSSSKLVNILRTIIASADQKGTALYLHFKTPTKEMMKQGVKNLDLNKIMANVGGEQFDYGTFKAAYDTDPRVKTMVKNFSADGVEPKTQKTIDNNVPQADASGDVVGQMAKSATNLGDKL